VSADLEALGFLALVVVVVAVAGLVVGRMIAARIDRWQQPATEEPVDDSDPG
jgi:hypothetical protein